tara:strand:- start:1044 stop:1169 length:126 start_codon:yes stop_codon:yes gene_type:complete
MTILINRIEELENKQDNGTITMNEEVLLNKLIERVESFLYA